MPIALPRKGRFPTGNTGRKDKQKLFRKQPVGLHSDSREEELQLALITTGLCKAKVTALSAHASTSTRPQPAPPHTHRHHGSSQHHPQPGCSSHPAQLLGAAAVPAQQLRQERSSQGTKAAVEKCSQGKLRHEQGWKHQLFSLNLCPWRVCC